MSGTVTSSPTFEVILREIVQDWTGEKHRHVHAGVVATCENKGAATVIAYAAHDNIDSTVETMDARKSARHLGWVINIEQIVVTTTRTEIGF